MTSTDQHYIQPATMSELFGATHAWRSMLRQAAAHISSLSEQPSDGPTRLALHDVANHLQQACALLTAVDTTIDSSMPPARRQHCTNDLTARAHHRDHQQPETPTQA